MENSNVLQERSAKYQYLVALVVSLLSATFGYACGWASPSINLLTSDESPLPSGRITMEEASWISSSLSIGGLFGNIFYGFITNAFGRKSPLILIAIPTIISWTLILYAQNVYFLYAARILAGFVGGGVMIMVPLFLSEISSDRVRGLLGSTLVFSSNIGFLLAYVFGNYFDFYAPPKMVIVVTTVFAISLFFFPESPSFLMKQNRVVDTENSIRFYQDMRRNTKDFRSLQLEINKLKNSFGGKIELGTGFKWSDVTTGPGRKAMTIGIVLVLINQFCGCFAMLNYTASIFKDAGSTMSPNMSAIIVAVIQLLGSYVATNLVDRAGRKFLFAVSTIGTALGLTTLGSYMMLKSWQFEVEAFSWIPLVSFSFVIFMAAWAILTLPFLVISEVMPDKLKDFGVSFCMSVVWFSQFIMLKFLPLLIDSLGFHGTMFLFSIFCLLSALFIILRMPETKGKSREQIMDALR